MDEITVNPKEHALIGVYESQDGSFIFIKAALQSAGMQYYEKLAIRAPGWDAYNYVTELYVDIDNKEKAAYVIKKVAEASPHILPSYCPKCDGETISEITKKVWIFTVRRFLCGECGHTWKIGAR